MKSAIVIGSGIAGLAASARLAARGYQVLVLEAASGPGGKLSQKKIGDYRFDLGPSLFTLPENVEDIFRECGEDPSIHFRYHRLDHLCTYFWDDGTRFRAPADAEMLADALHREFGEDRQRVLDYLREAAFTYERTAPVFLHRSLHRLNWLSGAVRRGVAAIPRLPLRGTLNERNKRFFRNPRTVQYFNRFATYNGSDPHQVPSMMSLIAHLEHGIGAYLPENGMFDITLSIYQLACRKGVKFLFNHRVNEILHDRVKVKGVRTDHGDFSADIVISNMDIHPTYRNLLKNHRAPEKLLSQEKSSSALIFYWGIKKGFPELGLHNIFFAGDYEKEFRAIFQDNTLHPDPTVYINITSRFVPADAPEGAENWFVMINVPRHSGQNWSEWRAVARKNILNKLSGVLGESIESLIEVEDVLDPSLIESRTSSFQGALYGNSSNSRYAAFLRHSNASSTLKGLYFCGGSVHPGGGIPLCLFGAKITVDMISQDEA